MDSLSDNVIQDDTSINRVYDKSDSTVGKDRGDSNDGSQRDGETINVELTRLIKAYLGMSENNEHSYVCPDAGLQNEGRLGACCPACEDNMGAMMKERQTRMGGQLC